MRLVKITSQSLRLRLRFSQSEVLNLGFLRLKKASTKRFRIWNTPIIAARSIEQKAENGSCQRSSRPAKWRTERLEQREARKQHGKGKLFKY